MVKALSCLALEGYKHFNMLKLTQNTQNTTKSALLLCYKTELSNFLKEDLQKTQNPKTEIRSLSLL